MKIILSRIRKKNIFPLYKIKHAASVLFFKTKIKQQLSRPSTAHISWANSSSLSKIIWIFNFTLYFKLGLTL